MDFLSENVFIDAGFQHLCESVFVRLCQIVGTSVQVVIRRETIDISEMVDRRVADNDDVIEMQSGSQREGFKLKGSDIDYMFWLNNHRVIWDMSQSEHYYTENKTLILSDSSESPPGFTLLELLTPSPYRVVQSACVPMNDRLYISSSQYRQQTQTHRFPGSIVHGPCESGEVPGGLEYDIARCFACDFWPLSASSWIDRCHSWPDREVVNEIVRNGCHFVPIGHSLGLHEHEEWRISFSLAEHKLVHSMNRCQFLTYGLLKIFLKEVIDKQSEETNKLLCSYHMKTLIFWVIQQNAVPLWCPQNLLAGFWVCFKLLLKWVYEGVCPNFFIPENNLFLSKVHGSAQRKLFLELHDLYEKGLVCLLQSHSIKSYITNVLYNPRLSICTNEDRMISECDHDIQLFDAIATSYSPQSLDHCIKYLHTIELMIGEPLTQYQVFILQRITATILQSTALTLHNMYTNTGLNKQMYIADRMSCHMLKLTAKFGCISDMMYIAMFYCKTFRYREALYMTEMIKVKLAQPGLMYRTHVDPERYTEAMGGQSWSTKMRQAVADDIRLNNYTCYINELTPEQQSALHNWDELDIPLFVLLHFIEFLCYRHIDTTLAQTALEELQVLVHHDQGQYVHYQFRDVSWEILGICQQMTGNLQAPLFLPTIINTIPMEQHTKCHTDEDTRPAHYINVSTHQLKKKCVRHNSEKCSYMYVFENFREKS
uniref:LOW QUALITY PROTEIN: uncharacterized protein LOC111108272 n=1 Tax=Crassostrea virginica TaxID=6565 RepID=A0A8B8B9Q9_CRAVI|nr:LOW QUALITY PROTEIN: uncharacterized protein LOC111108272 [Crassostrea virginica]